VLDGGFVYTLFFEVVKIVGNIIGIKPIAGFFYRITIGYAV
jgi:hypothetical protein